MVCWYSLFSTCIRSHLTIYIFLKKWLKLIQH